MVTMNNIDTWVKENRPMVKHIIKQFKIPPPVEFDDLEQIAWYEIVKAVDKYNKDKGEFQSYAYQCAYNGVLDYLKSLNNYHEDVEVDQIRLYNHKTNDDIVQCLYRGIREQLEEKYQDAIIHYYGIFDKNSTNTREETADKLNISKSCLDWRLTEGRETLRKWLRKNGYEAYDFYSLIIETEHSDQKVIWS